MTRPRGLRVEFAGAVHQLMARGNERRDSFRHDRDRKGFLETLGEMAERFGVRVLARECDWVANAGGTSRRRLDIGMEAA